MNSMEAARFFSPSKVDEYGMKSDWIDEYFVKSADRPTSTSLKFVPC